ncbi:YjjG family noncanonical pyrimidine nucleotidase [Aquimarina rhabdastrellae]
MKTVKDIFFDLDHTLWDFDKNSALAFQLLFKKHKIAIDIQEFLNEYEPINAQYWEKYRKDKIQKEELRRGRLIDTFNTLNLSFSVKKIDAIAQDYIEMLPLHNYLIEGTQELLEYLYPNFRLHIITNGFSEVQETKLQKSGIAKYFATLTTSEAVGVKKPNPQVFEYALAKAEATIEESLMIGDNYEADIVGADNIGMKTIWFNYHNQAIAGNCIEISRLIEVKKYL